MERIRIASSARQADEWALVLAAIGVPHAIAPDPGGWALLAAADDAARAHAALAAYEEERRPETPAEEPREPYPWMSGVLLGLLLLWLFSITGPAAREARWFQHGAAVAGRIVAGEAWRAVTALTLHADVVHVAGNAIALALLLPPLAQRFGAGIALLLLLATGALGNVLAAMIHDPRHVAVGASTAAFGAVGMLVALRLVPGAWRTTRRRWTAPVAGVVLLVTLGASRNADLAAHTSGFVVGIGVGVLAAIAIRRRLRARTQWPAGAVALLALAGCWWVALRA
jgi:membrane associated rhomboid family serine protease